MAIARHSPLWVTHASICCLLPPAAAAGQQRVGLPAVHYRWARNASSDQFRGQQACCTRLACRARSPLLLPALSLLRW